MSYGCHSQSRKCPMSDIHNLEVCYDDRTTSLSVFRSVAKTGEEIKMCTFLSKYLNVIPLYCLGDQERYVSARTCTVRNWHQVNIFGGFFQTKYFPNTCLPNQQPPLPLSIPRKYSWWNNFSRVLLMKQLFKGSFQNLSFLRYQYVSVQKTIYNLQIWKGGKATKSIMRASCFLTFSYLFYAPTETDI